MRERRADPGNGGDGVARSEVHPLRLRNSKANPTFPYGTFHIKSAKKKYMTLSLLYFLSSVYSSDNVYFIFNNFGY